ncbi:ARMT1-like domain-containing protein [Nocardia sp. NPDC051750]|uniref:ARMT1-like domain-containing protein n=1 Tax=Nocardia sp. NPDC051750 TaxID=3364325 RepID=UPI0037AE32E4
MNRGRPRRAVSDNPLRVIRHAVKGDLNYQQLIGDCNRPATTSFAALTEYFPTRVIALRTLKCDVAVGLAPVWSPDSRNRNRIGGPADPTAWCRCTTRSSR